MQLVWCADLFCTYRPTSQSGFGAGHFGEDVVGTRGPNERLWVVVVMLDVLGDGLLKIVHGCEAVAPDPVLGDVTKEPLDHVQPGGAGGREVHDEARMLCQPRANLRMLMRRVVVDDQVQDHLLGRLAIDEPKETEPFLVAMVVLAHRDDSAVERVERSKQSRRAIRTSTCA